MRPRLPPRADAHLAPSPPPLPQEDERISFKDLPALKSSGKLPNGQLPVLHVGEGTTFCQSTALSRYAAKLASLYPNDALAALIQDEVVATIDEVWSKVPANEPALRAAYGDSVAPKFLPSIAARLGDASFFGGATPGWADLWVYVYVSFFTSGFFDGVDKDFVVKCAPSLAALAERVKASELYTKHGKPE